MPSGETRHNIESIKSKRKFFFISSFQHLVGGKHNSCAYSSISSERKCDAAQQRNLLLLPDLSFSKEFWRVFGVKLKKEICRNEKMERGKRTSEYSS